MGSKDKKEKSVKSKSSDKKSSKSKSADKKSTKSDKSGKDKKDKSKSKDKDAKSSKSGKSSKSVTPSKDKKDADKKSSKSKGSSKKDKSSKIDEQSTLERDVDATMEATKALDLGTVKNQPGVFATMQMNNDSPFAKFSGSNAHVTQKKSCMLHNKPLIYFCDTDEELGCYDCTVMGPHNTQLHRICNMDEAFRYRFETVNKAIHSNIVPKRAQLIGQIVRLDHRLDEIKTVKGVIERDIRNEYAGIMERLKSAEGVKTAVLQHDIAEVQKDITRIDEILMFMEEIAVGEKQQQPPQVVPTPEGGDAAAVQNPEQPKGPDTIGFLHSYRQLNENIEYAVTKQFKVDIEVYPNDLPRELAERQILLEHYEEQRKLLKFKDDVVWKLSQELKKKYDFYQEEFDKETRHEMNEWARLVDRYANELKKYELVCAFCGQHMSEQTVNTECADNCADGAKSVHSQQDQVYFTEEEPESDCLNKRRHWFGRPSMRGFRVANPIRNQDAAFSTQVGKADQIITKNPESASLLKKIYEATSTQANQQDLIRRFKACDPTNSGSCKKDDFVNSMFESIKGVKPFELMTLINLFAVDDFVNYDDFLRMVDRYGELGNAEFKIEQKSQGFQNQDDEGRRDAIEKVRNSCTQAAGGLAGVEQALRKFGGKGGETVSHEELLIALSHVNAVLTLDEVKDFFNVVRGGTLNTEVQVGEVMQLLSM